MKFTIVLNGTERNLYERFGLKRNPFPAIARAEYGAANSAISKLAEPGCTPERVRHEMGRIGADKDFIEKLAEAVIQGEVHSIEITFPGDS